MADPGHSRSPLRMTLLLWLIAVGLALHTLNQGGLAHNLSVLLAAHPTTPDQLVLQTLWLPRQMMALISGAVLALCGWLLQRALNNPLAEPMTLGITSGASLAMGLAAMWFPSLLIASRTGVIIAGELCALAAVLLLSWRQRLTPLVVIQAGMMINLWCGSMTLLLAIINDRFLLSVMIWGGGNLALLSWQPLLQLLPALAACLILLVVLLPLLRLPENMVRGLGASPALIRLTAVLLSVLMTALIINVVGVIGFIGLAAPHIARLSGARTPVQSLIWTPLIGSALLWLTDQAISQITLLNGQLLPVGMMTALAGGPLLMVLAGRLRNVHPSPVPLLTEEPAPASRCILPLLLLLLPAAVILSLWSGAGPYGWHWANISEWQALLPFRLPRMIAAISAGCLLAGAGVLMQRLSGNPLASPEVLGIGGGAAIGMTLFLLLAGATLPGLLLSSAAGAILSLMFTLWNSRGSAFNPQRVLLNGLALNALFQAVASVALLNFPQASSMLLQLMTGSTYYVTRIMALTLFIATLILLVFPPLLRRWLLLLPLGAIAGSVGVPVARARLLTLILAALMTALATLVVGPVSFVGLLGPHLARKAEAQRPLAQFYYAALISAAIMTLSDWLGRNLLYPRQIPVGLIAGLIGVPLLLWPLLRRRGRQQSQTE